MVKEVNRGYSERLTREDVARLAKLRGLPVEESDLDEIRFRLNALSDALAALDDPELDTSDPLPILLDRKVH